MNKIDRMIGNIMGKKKGASIAKQHQWKGFSPIKKQHMIKKYPDRDKDGVPNRWDCQPWNPKEQDRRLTKPREVRDTSQTL